MDLDTDEWLLSSTAETETGVPPVVRDLTFLELGSSDETLGFYDVDTGPDERPQNPTPNKASGKQKRSGPNQPTPMDTSEPQPGPSTAAPQPGPSTAAPSTVDRPLLER